MLTRRRLLCLSAAAPLAAAGCRETPAARPARPGAVAPRPRAPRAARYAHSVSADRHLLLDQHGRPLLGLADTVWTMPAVYGAADLAAYFSTRRAQGFTAVHVAVWPFHFDGDEPVDGCTDGVQAFLDRDVTRWNETYWSRVDRMLASAAEHGFTVYAGVMATDLGYDLDEQSARVFGGLLGRRYRDQPHLVWLFGVDYRREDWAAYDPVFLACLDGIRAAGDRHLVTIQYFNDDSLSHDDPAWRGRTDLESAYTYRPTYAVVRKGYALGTGPVVLAEANFEDENNAGGPPTTDETIRRQALWTFTSGGVHVAYGRQAVWRSDDDHLDRLESTAVTQLCRIHAKVASLDWPRLVPDLTGSVLVAGAGEAVTRGTVDGVRADVLESDHATCAATPDRSLVLVYVPTPRPVTLAGLPPGSVAEWWDPTGGPSVPAALPGPFTPPADTHADGTSDWLLVVERREGAR